MVPWLLLYYQLLKYFGSCYHTFPYLYKKKELTLTVLGEGRGGKGWEGEGGGGMRSIVRLCVLQSFSSYRTDANVKYIDNSYMCMGV